MWQSPDKIANIKSLINNCYTTEKLFHILGNCNKCKCMLKLTVSIVEFCTTVILTKIIFWNFNKITWYCQTRRGFNHALIKWVMLHIIPIQVLESVSMQVVLAVRILNLQIKIKQIIMSNNNITQLYTCETTLSPKFSKIVIQAP